MDKTPAVALRTYMTIRIGVVAVIVALGVAVAMEIAAEDESCIQRSLSAYYYTPVRPVFVGALLIIGFAMITMWGKTFVEDAALNLAGLLLIVVGLVPTLDANYCSLDANPAASADPEQKQISDRILITENADTVARSFTALMVVAALALLLALIIGLVMRAKPAGEDRPTDKAMLGYAITWLLAVVTWLLYLWAYQGADDLDSFFNHDLHGMSANIGVGLVIVAVLAAAGEKAQSGDQSKPWWRRWKPRHEWDKWVWLYGFLAALMVLSAAVLKIGDANGLFPEWIDVHATFLLEAILIVLLGAYWILQTIERRKDGAPTYLPEQLPLERDDREQLVPVQ